jgi:hypothetical protein
LQTEQPGRPEHVGTPGSGRPAHQLAVLALDPVALGSEAALHVVLMPTHGRLLG